MQRLPAGIFLRYMLLLTHMKKLTMLGIVLSVSLCALTSESIRVLTLNGPSGIALARFMETPPKLEGSSISASLMPSVDTLLPQLINGEAQAGVLPPNIAAKLYNRKKNSIRLAAITGTGMLSIITPRRHLGSVADLSGKTLYATGPGSTPEYLIRSIIKGRSISNLQLDFSFQQNDLALAVAAGRVEYALLPEPFATAALMSAQQRGVSLSRALGSDALAREAGFSHSFPMTVFVINAELASSNPEAVTRMLAAIRESIEWTNANPREASLTAHRMGFSLKPELVEQAIPTCGLTYIDGKNAISSVEELLSVFLTFAPEAIGGSLPSKDFYLR